MKRVTLTAVCLAVALPVGGAALAQQNHQHGQIAETQAGQSATMQADGGHMMQKMQNHMKMMEAMMDGSKMGRHTPMGREFMDMLDMDGDGNATSEEARAQLQKVLEENDTGGDGSLNISEFENFHSRLVREKMVDRFQHLDADGSGEITAEEIVAPAENIEQKQRKMKKRHSMQE